MTATVLNDVHVPTRYKLAAMWTSVMFCFIYADYFELYVPGKLQSMLAGKILPLGEVTQGVLMGTGAMLALPSLMILLCVILKAPLCRWVNVAMGALYAAIQLAVISRGGWTFYVAFGALEAALLALIVLTALKWPAAARAGASHDREALK